MERTMDDWSQPVGAFRPTADICDEYGSQARVSNIAFGSYGGVRTFSGIVATVACREDNVLVRSMLEVDGEGKVLVVDGGGSTATALLGDQIGELAAKNGWKGVIVNGAVRDVALLKDLPLGILAIGANPLRSAKRGGGSSQLCVSIGGVPVYPGDSVFADEDGLVFVSADVRPRESASLE